MFSIASNTLQGPYEMHVTRDEINELETSSENRNNRYMCRGINLMLVYIKM